MAPKRKRSSATAVAASDPVAIQPSSRDASGEDTADPVSSGVIGRKLTDPPAKRSRSTRSQSTSKKHAEADQANGEDHVAKEMPVNTHGAGGGENGEAGATMRMEPPPHAGAVDPVGYQTNPPPKGRPVRVYADGVFDLFHLGHMRQLQQAKMGFEDVHLIVGVTGDAETHKRKGLTVMSAKERAEALRHCRWIDEVIEDCPWVITVEFLEAHKIDYVAHDDLPYGASEGDDIYAPIKERGMFLVTQRTEGVSTTGIITKIVRDYEQYISRQLKRGTSRQELNISWLKKNELDVKRHVTELRDAIRSNWTTTGLELSRDFSKFWQPSRSSSPAPSLHNGNHSRGTPSITRPLSRSSTPQTERKNMDFAAGYAMGLIGGVKGWMEGSKRRNLAESRPQSPGQDEDSPASSPIEGSSRGRQKLSAQDQASAQLAEEDKSL